MQDATRSNLAELDLPYLSVWFSALLKPARPQTDSTISLRFLLSSPPCQHASKEVLRFQREEKEWKKKANSGPSDSDRAREKEEEEKLANEFLATSLGQSLGITDERIAAAGGFRAPTSPDDPPCDGCAKLFAGTNQCSGCESVFYCSRECQVSHWTAGHKTECKQLKERNEATAARVLAEFKEFRNWSDLDIAGAYKAAVHQGLHDKIREVLELDKAEIVDRYKNDRGVFICYAQCVMSMLFRGQRSEGRAVVDSPAFNCVDGVRIKGYVRSHPEALDAWLQASVQVIRAVTDRPTMLRKPHLHRVAHTAGRDVWSGWSLVFTSPTAARAILMPYPSPTATDATGDVETAEQRRKRGEDYARGIVKTLGEAIRVIAGAASDPRLDTNSVIEGYVCTVAAMVLLRVQEYGIGIDVEGILNLKGVRKEMFRHVALPIAKRTIEKGRTLNSQEANAVMAVSTRGLGLS